MNVERNMYTSVYVSTFTLHTKHLKYHSRDFDSGPVVRTVLSLQKKKTKPKHLNFNLLGLYQILFVALGHQGYLCISLKVFLDSFLLHSLNISSG